MDLGLKGKTFVVGGGSKGPWPWHRQRTGCGGSTRTASRDQESIDRAIAELGDAAVGVTGDMAAPDTADKVNAAVDAHFGGKLDGVVINAGGPPAGKALDLTDEQWLGSYQLLIGGPLRLLKLLVPKINDGGAILFITSTSVRQPVNNLDTSNVLRPGATALPRPRQSSWRRGFASTPWRPVASTRTVFAHWTRSVRISRASRRRKRLLSRARRSHSAVTASRVSLAHLRPSCFHQRRPTSRASRPTPTAQ
ncbi:MAG: SDR family oxidoreductase [Thermomicrobiales bacterium]